MVGSRPYLLLPPNIVKSSIDQLWREGKLYSLLFQWAVLQPACQMQGSLPHSFHGICRELNLGLPGRHCDGLVAMFQYESRESSRCISAPDSRGSSQVRAWQVV